MKKVFCNPLDLEYRYQYRTSKMGGFSLSREAADPTIVVFQNTYFLFASMSCGFWYSKDLVEWNYKATPELPAYDYAPDVREVAGKVVFSASRRGDACTFYVSANPLEEEFVPVSTPFDFWDPDVFEDEDGRVYFYWGCSNSEPIYGIEMDPKTLLPIGEKKIMIEEDESHHGWERKGENNKLGEPKTEYERLVRQYVGTKPFIEGAYMTKYKGKYYLQYSAPGTESNVYADGVYVGKNPLGPFTYHPHNPFSSKPGGFIQSAGHGSTFQDLEGNWWHVSTMRISVNESYERRVGLFPCDFDKDDVLYCNQNYADYPITLPGNRTSIQPEMNLLSYHKKVSASSEQVNYEAIYGTDENIQTWWAADKEDKNPWYQMDLGEEKSVSAIQINLADHQHTKPDSKDEKLVENQTGFRYIFTDSQKTSYVLDASLDGEHWEVLLDTRKENSDRPHRLWLPEEPICARYFRIRDFVIPFDGVPAISGLRVFGKGNGVVPASVDKVEYGRTTDGLNILLSWETVIGADGYNVRYGTTPEKMYNSWQVIGKTELDLSTINSGQSYYISVDCYNENGVTEGSVFNVN